MCEMDLQSQHYHVRDLGLPHALPELCPSDFVAAKLLQACWPSGHGAQGKGGTYCGKRASGQELRRGLLLRNQTRARYQRNVLRGCMEVSRDNTSLFRVVGLPVMFVGCPSPHLCRPHWSRLLAQYILEDVWPLVRLACMLASAQITHGTPCSSKAAAEYQYVVCRPYFCVWHQADAAM